MNRAALTLGTVLILAISVFVGGLEFAFQLAKSSGRIDEIAFRQEYGDVNVSSPVYNFSPPVFMYRAVRTALESDGWNTTSLTNMTLFVSLDYREFDENITIMDGKYTTAMLAGSHWIKDVVEPTDSYDPVIVHSATNGTITYRYVWNIVINYSEGLTCIPPPGLYWVDAATAEIVSTGPLAI